ncbi:hypothetical protein [Cryptosporidium parvum Iowa II]|uniref:Uncharacterized protein n=2 Tax=Cryptosporidium parvum TaxID=5807 RepID=Q5CW19_CRYPI|nr:hypothetical protein [Cryptosporidium parvum Iowa II]EAK89398.1 hypothetical protein cgd8_1960 [Cryptosporidium parvum Iowa II]QOY39952.1 Uncharacterized protein CPATCC_0002070 [Cryptosporidium parvum]WKS79447.1 hypothetical protein CPCDC_8g1960 [Cryptosporidium sp. 43IA8]WRK33949.1 Uncharacterized protein cpbgf_8001960 [Cryptosporidium parvum]|eukprot:QOY39952.1 hypothetical protein CPATCC_004017 [Cryptosporidium parvum]
MNESEIEFIEDEKNKIIIIDSQDQEDFSVVEEIVNEENILIEGYLWEERSILHQFDEINQNLSKSLEDTKEETPIINTGEDYGDDNDDDLEYEIINNLEVIELENKVMKTEISKSEKKDENENKLCFDIFKTEELPISSQKSPRIEESEVDLKSENQLIKHAMSKSQLKALFSIFKISNYTQTFRSIAYLNRIQAIMSDYFRRSRYQNRMVILNLIKKKRTKSSSKTEFKFMKKENYLLKNEQNNNKCLQLEDSILQNKVKEKDLQAKNANNIFELTVCEKASHEEELKNFDQTIEEDILVIEIKDSEEPEFNELMENRIFEVLEEAEDGDFQILDSDGVNPDIEKNLELDANLETGSQKPIEIVEFSVNNTSELDLELKSESDVGSKLDLEAVFELEGFNEYSEVELSNPIVNMECKISQGNPMLEGLEHINHELEFMENREAAMETLNFKLESQNIDNNILKEVELDGVLTEKDKSNEKQNDNDERNVTSPQLTTEGNCDVFVEIIAKEDLENAQTDNYSGFESIENFELTRKSSQMSHNLTGIISFEETNANNETEIIEKQTGTTNQEDENNNSYQPGIEQIEINVDIEELKQNSQEKLSKLDNEKDVFELVKDIQNSKNDKCSPFYEKSETYNSNKTIRSSPYESLQGIKKKSFGVFDKLVSLAQNRSIARPISKDLSRESIRAIEIIKKSRKLK